MKNKESYFSSFVVSLINDTMQAVVSSHIEQENRILELRQGYMLEDDLFIEKYNIKEEAKNLLQDGTEDEINGLSISIAKKQKEILGEIISKGVPKVVVDKGAISAKVLFSILEDNDNENSSSEKENTSPQTPSESKGDKDAKSAEQKTKKHFDAKMLIDSKAVNLTTALKKSRVVVKPITQEDKSIQDSSSDIVGEVQINFSTIFV